MSQHLQTEWYQGLGVQLQWYQVATYRDDINSYVLRQEEDLQEGHELSS